MTQDALHDSDSNHCIAVENIRMGEKNNPYFVVLMSCWSSWFHSKEVSNKVASAANFIQTQCIVSSGVHFSLCNSSLLVYKCTLQVFKCTDEALRVSYELHCLLVHESTTTKVAPALEQKASLSEAKLPSSTFATLMYNTTQRKLSKSHGSVFFVPMHHRTIKDQFYTTLNYELENAVLPNINDGKYNGQWSSFQPDCIANFPSPMQWQCQKN